VNNTEAALESPSVVDGMPTSPQASTCAVRVNTAIVHANMRWLRMDPPTSALMQHLWLLHIYVGTQAALPAIIIRHGPFAGSAVGAGNIQTGVALLC
jgi:hypothetical protein